jgi:hypothetical protein
MTAGVDLQLVALVKCTSDNGPAGPWVSAGCLHDTVSGPLADQ